MTLASDRASKTADGTDAIVDRVVDAFDAMLRLRPASDAFPEHGRACMASMARPFVAAGVAIPLVLPGFAHKSPNRQKTLGPLPDLAEHAALKHLDAFCARVAELYPAGCRLALVADGRVWSDLTGVDPADASAYGLELRRMIAGCPHIDAYDLGDLLYTPTAAAMEAQCLTPRDHDALRALLAEPRGAFAEGLARVKRLIAEDGLRVPPRRLLVRQRAFDAVLAARFPEHIRLSVHAQDDRGPRFGCRFGPTPPRRGHTPTLPYHGVAVRAADDAVEVMHLADARALPGGVTLETIDGRPWCLGKTHA